MKDEKRESIFERCKRSEYVRPSNKWICGNASQGCSCQIGPDSKGRCRATFECKPLLELKEGEIKGRYICTRADSYGGVCEEGPKPNGECCRAITKCKPIRSMRFKRGVFSFYVFLITLIFLFSMMISGWRSEFINPGTLSSVHSSDAFYYIADLNKGEENCIVCHKGSDQGFSSMIKESWEIQNTTLSFSNLLSDQFLNMEGTEKNCLSCHETKGFHQARIDKNPNCWSCHEDHKGVDNPLTSTDTECLYCHGSQKIMEESKEVGLSSSFQNKSYTGVITAFGKDHPSFHTESKGVESDSHLKFDHALHLSKGGPLLNGEGLSCVSCHTVNQSGKHFRKITFEDNCQVCHELQFDIYTPQLHLPHKKTSLVRAFLRSLPMQYEKYAIDTQGINRFKEIEEFVDEKMVKIREQYPVPYEIESVVFFGKNMTYSEHLSEMKGDGDSHFEGCVLCHEMDSTDARSVNIVPVEIKESWMLHAEFNHIKHDMMRCDSCHEVNQSKEGLEVSLPGIALCTECHNPEEKAHNQCVLCHKFHNIK